MTIIKKIQKLIQTPRPSKQQFFSYFEADTKVLASGSVVLDIASYIGMNQRYFDHCVYLPADINTDYLQKINSVPCKVEANILHLPFADQSLDAVVSTHTLSHLPPDRRVDAIVELSRLVKPGGYLLFNLSFIDRSEKLIDHKRLQSLIEKDYQVVRDVRYRGVLSRMFEATLLPLYKKIKFPSKPTMVVYMLLAVMVFAIEQYLGFSKIESRERYFFLRKKNGPTIRQYSDIFSRLVCIKDQVNLSPGTDGFRCPSCGQVYAYGGDGIIHANPK